MDIMETARTLAGEGKTAEAVEAYTAALQHFLGKEPEAELEAALYLLQFGEDYKLPYTCFYYLYQRGFVREDILAIMEQAFYAPNVKLLKKRYEKNCKLLTKYPYLFRKDFVPFEDLPLCFFPYEDGVYYPFDLTTGELAPLFTPNDPVISRNFFKELTNPVLADDVYSQYELEYLYDNVRKSEHVARENHIYLHYTNWAVFCAYLQVLDLSSVLEEEKIVFLVEEEISRYPIDFKAEYGIDYTQYPLKPVGIKEINRLIWHVQLSAHNGGDFFNEVFDEHPNLLFITSLMMDNLENAVNINLSRAKLAMRKHGLFRFHDAADEHINRQLDEVRDWTAKDMLVAMFLNGTGLTGTLDHASRITPALFLQPHFVNRTSEYIQAVGNELMVPSPELEIVQNSPMIKDFKYIKTFAPLRRPTNSYAAVMRYARRHISHSIREQNKDFEETRRVNVVDASNFMARKAMGRTFMVDPDDRMHKDSVVVRLEDSKLNPKAMFTALAAFLDLPYTASMEYCSLRGQRDPGNKERKTVGFDASIVNKTYDEFANSYERCFVEYCLRDLYEYYGYDFHFYDGKPMTEEQIQNMVDHFTTAENFYLDVIKENIDFVKSLDLQTDKPVDWDQILESEGVKAVLAKYREENVLIGRLLSMDLKFVNKERKLLRMIPWLKPDPALMVTELYH